MGSSGHLLSSPTGNDPACPKLALLARPSGGPRKVARLCGERRSSAMIELSRLRGSERYAACSDEVVARPSAWLSQRACCLKKLFTCQGTPCRRGQTVTGSGTGRSFWFGKSFTLRRTSFARNAGVYREKFFALHITTDIFSALVREISKNSPTLQRTVFLKSLAVPDGEFLKLCKQLASDSSPLTV